MIDTLAFRKVIGWLGMLLPIIVLALALIFGYGMPDSISATYYEEHCITPFMIILGAAGLLLICYKGYDLQDNIVCTAAGISGLLICLFPCANYMKTNVGTFGVPQNISGIIHNIAAVVFFALLAYNSIFLFTKTTGEMTAEKRKRNIVYKVCGWGMIGSFVIMVPVVIFDIFAGTWVIEAIALAFFGISWLTKSSAYSILFKDKTSTITEE